MKRTIFVLSILIAGIMLSAQTIGTNNLYQKYKGEKGVISIYIPGFAIRLAGSIADLDREERKLLRSIKSVRILTIEDQERFKGVNFAREAKIKPGQGGFKMMIEVSEGGEDVKILGREKNGKLKDLLILVGGDENVMVHIKGRMNADMIGSLSDIAGLNDINIISQL